MVALEESSGPGKFRIDTEIDLGVDPEVDFRSILEMAP